MEMALEALRPTLLKYGGKQRTYLLCRDKFEKQLIQNQIQELKELGLTSILSRTAVPTLFQEGQQIDLKQVISWLDSLTGDDGKISERLLTRSDIVLG